MTNLNVNEQSQKFEFGDVRFEGSYTPRYDSGTKYDDLEVDDKEIDAALAKIHDKGYKNVDRATLETVQKENAKRMRESVDKFKKAMASKGYKVKINAYNDANHAVGIGKTTGSHLMGQKVDLDFTTKDGKITMANMTEAQRKEIVDMAKAAGLVPNWETNGADWSGWGDFALAEAKSINEQGQIEDIKITSWTGENEAMNTGTGKKQKVGK